MKNTDPVQLEVGEHERIESFNLKNDISPEISGKITVAFLLDMLLNNSYILTPFQKQDIKTKLFEIGICNQNSDVVINWTKIAFLLMPGVYNDMENDKSLKIAKIGGNKKQRKTKKQTKNKKQRKTKRRKTKRRKSTKR